MADSENATLEYVADPALENEEMKKLYVTGICTESEDSEVKTFFEEMCGGEVTDNVIIRKDKERKTHFGFLTFANSELIDELLLRRSELVFKDKTLEVNRAVPKTNTSAGAHERTKKMFIANLPRNDCSEEDLRNYFEARHPKKYGTIEEIQLIKQKDEQGNKTEENKGYGFVMVSTEDMADKMAIQHSTFEFGGRKIELKKSVPTSEGGGGRGRGRGRGRGGGMRGGNSQGYYGGSYGGGGGGYGYGAAAGGGYGYGAGYGAGAGGYGAYGAGGGYGGGYAAGGYGGYGGGNGGGYY